MKAYTVRSLAIKGIKKYSVMKTAYPEFKFLGFKQNINKQNIENGVLYQQKIGIATILSSLTPVQWYHMDEIFRCFLLFKITIRFCEQKEVTRASEAPWFLGSYKWPEPTLHVEPSEKNWAHVYKVKEGKN